MIPHVQVPVDEFEKLVGPALHIDCRLSEGVEIIAEGGTVTVRMSLHHRKQGGRKVVIGEGQSTNTPTRRNSLDGRHRTILKALGRAHRWKRMLESGEFSSITDLAAVEKINHSYLRRILRLTLLSPAIVERILDGRFTKRVQLEDLLKRVTDEWTAQGF